MVSGHNNNNKNNDKNNNNNNNNNNNKLGLADRDGVGRSPLGLPCNPQPSEKPMLA